MRNREFRGGSYARGDCFNVSMHGDGPLNREQWLEMTLDALTNPSPGTLAAIKAYNNNHKVVKFVDRPIPTFWEYIKIRIIGRWPDVQPVD